MSDSTTLPAFSHEVVTPSSSVRGRPKRPTAQTGAERAKALRQRKNDQGLKALKCHLTPLELAYLKALREVHHLDNSALIGLLITSALTGLPLPSPPTP